VRFAVWTRVSRVLETAAPKPPASMRLSGYQVGNRRYKTKYTRFWLPTVDTSKSNIYPVFIYNCSSSFVFRRVKYLPSKTARVFVWFFHETPSPPPQWWFFEVFEMPGSPGGSLNLIPFSFGFFPNTSNPVVRFFDAEKKKTVFK
jgi:hypothetical protein